MADHVVFAFGNKHNICAYLDPTTKHGQDFREVIEFLRRSRILHAISVHCDVYNSHIQGFWNNAHLETINGLVVIRSSVFGNPIQIGEADIRRVLHLGGEPEGLINLTERCIKGCFLRIKYFGVYDVKSIKKGKLPLQYKYLAHVLLHCLGMRKGTFDELRDIMRSAMVALILNKPFNFSGMIFKFMIDNVAKSKDKFLLYPRFIQLMIDQQYPGNILARLAEDRLKFLHMTDKGLGQIKTYQKTNDVIAVKGMIGHLLQVDYVAPENNDWRHPDSDSDAEIVDIEDQQPPPPPPPQAEPVAPVAEPVISEAFVGEPQIGPEIEFDFENQDPVLEGDDIYGDLNVEDLYGGLNVESSESESEWVQEGNRMVRRLKKRPQQQVPQAEKERRTDPDYVVEESPESSRPKKRIKVMAKRKKSPKKKSGRTPRLVVTSSVTSGVSAPVTLSETASIPESVSVIETTTVSVQTAPAVEATTVTTRFVPQSTTPTSSIPFFDNLDDLDIPEGDFNFEDLELRRRVSLLSQEFDTWRKQKGPATTSTGQSSSSAAHTDDLDALKQQVAELMRLRNVDQKENKILNQRVANLEYSAQENTEKIAFLEEENKWLKAKLKEVLGETSGTVQETTPVTAEVEPEHQAQPINTEEDDEQMVDYGDSEEEDFDDDESDDDHPGIKPHPDEDDDGASGADGNTGLGAKVSESSAGEGTESTKDLSPPLDVDPVSSAGPSDLLEIEDITNEEYPTGVSDESLPSFGDIFKEKEKEMLGEIEEGELIHDYTADQLAAMFEVSLKEVTDQGSSETIPVDTGGVIVEFEEGEVGASQNTTYDLSVLAKVFEADTIKRSEIYLSQRLKLKACSKSEVDILEEQRMFDQRMEDFKKFVESYDVSPPPSSPKQISVFKIGSKSKMRGKILCYGYFHNIPGKLVNKGTYVVKRTDGVQYFGKAYDLKTLPYYDFMQLAKLKMIKPIQTEHNERFEDLLKSEFRKGWNWLRPQFPKIVVTDKVDTWSGRLIKKNIYKKPVCFKRTRLRKVEQDWTPYFKFWFYDDNTSEAVIVLQQDLRWRVIRLLDPVWIVNCSKQDMETLYDAPIHFKHGFHAENIKFKDMALQFKTMSMMCFALGIHSGCNWNDVNDLYNELLIVQEEQEKRDEELKEKEILAEEERLRRMPRSVIIRASENVDEAGTSGNKDQD